MLLQKPAADNSHCVALARQRLTPTVTPLVFSVWCLQLVEGATLLLGAAACLLVSLGPLCVHAPSLGLALLLGLMLSGMEGFLTGDDNLYVAV
jgi:hypothetical protein